VDDQSVESTEEADVIGVIGTGRRGESDSEVKSLGRS